MRTIVAGSRSIKSYAVVSRVLDRCPWDITTVLCGEADGVDQLGKRWAKEHSVEVELWPADWTLNGKPAGIIRNCAMAKHADAAVVIWDGESRGSKHMVDEALARGLHVLLVNQGK